MKTNKKLNFVDSFMLIFCITLLAFKDYSYLSLIIQAVTFTIVLINYLKENNLKLKIKDFKFFLYKILFIIFCTLSSLWSINSMNSLNMVLSIGFRTLMGLTICLYSYKRENLYKILKYIILSSIILCIRMILVVPISSWGNVRIGVYLSHNSNNSYGLTGITYVLGFASSILLASDSIIANKKIRYSVFLILFFFSLLSGSKKQILFFLITIIIMIFFKSKNLKKLIKNTIGAILIMIIFMYIIFSNQKLYNIIGKRVLSFLSYSVSDISVDTDASTISRNYFLKDAFTTFTCNPIIGVGIDGYKFLNKYAFCWAENNFVELLADTGLIGFFIYYLIYFLIAIDIRKRIKYKQNEDFIITVMFICFLMVDFTMVSYANSTLQFYLAIMYCLNEQNKINEKAIQINY